MANLDSVFCLAGQEALWLEQQEQIVQDFLEQREQIQRDRSEIQAKNREIKEQREQAYLDSRVAKSVSEYAGKLVFQQKFMELPSFSERTSRFLSEKYGIPKDCCEKLYHHSAIDRFPAVPASVNKLGSPENDAIRNPLVNRALHEVRRLVNCLLAEGKIDRETQLVIEMANEANSENMRRAIEEFQRMRKKERDTAIAAIESEFKVRGASREPREDEILRYILWDEQDRMCLYTGKQIGIAAVLDGKITDIEHTYPLSQVCNNARENKTLCMSAFNRQTKVAYCPKELYQKGLLAEEQMKQRLKPWADKIASLEKKILNAQKASKQAEKKEEKDKQIIRRNRLKMELEYWKRKYSSFFEDVPTNFAQRNLVDTRVISKYTKEYLKSYFSHVYTARGAQVSEFRQEILNMKMRSDEAMLEGRVAESEKDRSEHSHHMVDALTLCFLLPFLLQKQGKNIDLRDFYWVLWRRKHCSDAERLRIEQDLPQHRRKLLGWKGPELGGLIARLRRELLVSHERRINKELWFIQHEKVRGGLHKEKYYGKIMRPVYNEAGQIVKDELGRVEGEETFVKRKQVGSLSDANIAKVIDPALRQHLQQLNDLELKAAIANGYFLWRGNKVWGLRLAESLKGHAIKAHSPIGQSPKLERQSYKQFLYADLRNNHHVQVFVGPEQKLKEDMCSFWEVVERQKQGLPVFQPVPEGWELLICLQIGKLFLLGLGEEQKGWEAWDARRQAKELHPYLYRVTKLSSGDYALMRHNIAGSFTDIKKRSLVKSDFCGRDKAGKKYASPEGLRLSSLAKLLKLNLCEVKIGPDGQLRKFQGKHSP